VIQIIAEFLMSGTQQDYSWPFWFEIGSNQSFDPISVSKKLGGIFAASATASHFSPSAHFDPVTALSWSRWVGTGSLTGDRWLKALLDKHFQNPGANWLTP
jgi:hypothetical protein